MHDRSNKKERLPTFGFLCIENSVQADAPFFTSEKSGCDRGEPFSLKWLLKIAVTIIWERDFFYLVCHYYKAS